MTEELNEQVEAGAVTETGGEVTPSESMADGTQSAITPEAIQAQVDAAVQAAIDEYEKADGHLAKLRRKKDLEIAGLQKQIEEQRTGKLEEAQKLMASDPARAAQILAQLVEAQANQTTEAAKHRELLDWQHKILADMGTDPEKDEEAVALVEEWAPKLIADPRNTWDFQQAAAMQLLDRERKAAKEASAALAELQDGMGDLIKAEVTKALVGAGIVPDTDGGGAPATKEEDWRDLPPSKLIKMGLEDRKKKPIIRT